MSQPDLVAPGAEEARMYYHGLTGGNLIVRSNGVSKKWEDIPRTYYDPGQGIILRQKMYVGIGHITEFQVSDKAASLKLYNAYPEIVKVLEEENIPWVFVTGIRIGYRDFFPKPHEFEMILYVNVDFGTTFDLVKNATRRIVSVLASIDLKIPVEVRENAIELCAASKGLEDLSVATLYHPRLGWDPTAQLGEDNAVTAYDQHFDILTSTVGWPISRFDIENDMHGTSGPFISFKNDPNTYSLTALHIFQDLNAVKELEGNEHGKEQISAKIRQEKPFNRFIQTKEFRDIQVFQATPEQVVNMCWCGCVSRLEALESDVDDMRNTNEERDFCGRLLAELKKLPAHLPEDATEDQVKERFVGTVWLLPKFEPITSLNNASSAPIGFMVDFALIQLKKNSGFKYPRNEIFLDYGDIARMSISKPFHLPLSSLNKSHRWGVETKVRLRETYAHRLNGEYLQDPHPSNNPFPVKRVVMRGATSGVKFGATNGIEVIVRRGRKDENSGTVRWYAVYQGLILPEVGRKNWTDESHTFAHPGDSGGAIVAVEDGCYLGQLEARGARNRMGEGMDIAFFTPAFAIMDLIKGFTKQTPFIKTVDEFDKNARPLAWKWGPKPKL